jgi:pyruvate/2-oxoglutarate dehydrogenase complex dihydrolipoamide dehydrogenase (E3) component
LVTAAGAAGLGAIVALIEKHLTGGDCLNVGCVPSKALIRCARAAADARATAPPIKGLAEAGYLTHETVFSLTELPRRLAIIGAGPIGCEMAQAFARFGSQVTLIEADKQILIREDYDAARRIEAALVRDGVKIICGGKAAEVRRQGNERFLRLECGGQSQELTVDAILVGVGRVPNVEGLNLEAVGVQYDKRVGVTVDDRLRTTNRRIFAAGDICSKYKFTHGADAMARIVIQNALFFGRAKASALTIPWYTYTDPEIAHVGMYEKDA